MKRHHYLQNITNAIPFLLVFIFLIPATYAQKPAKDSEPKKEDLSAIYSGLQFRSIGPALMSGRIADIVIHPDNENVWYVAVGSGGVWKTENAGTTWTSIFDDQISYSIGCITLDPQNPEIVWVGTGENVGGRHVGYGDGIYKSEDGGQSWKHMGLPESMHLSKIVIHPSQSNIIWVASQGPLWSSGGERGVYKSIDGGNTWSRTLGDEEWIGATDLLIDPRNPDMLYAATWQRHRTVAGYVGGGPGTAIYKSTDGGDTWSKLTKGLPSGNMGKIGLAMSPQKPDVIYAAIELDRRTGGVFRSENQGASWTKMSDAVAGGTGPHYYQELYVSPHRFDELYLANNYMLVSFDGGKTFTQMNEEEKHVDNHAVAFKKNDPNYILVGCDGGLYESFDGTKNWKYIDNLPVTQFYKIAVDDALPYYFVYGGTQDNNTQGAPSQTDNVHGIRNSDWFIVLGGDGHQPATEPGNPNIVYAQWQQGGLTRHDRISGENVNIKPQPRLGEPTERHNWDAPILVSPHNPKRIYHASQRVWKSEDRGDSWEPISDDLTNNIDRIRTPFYGKKQKWDNAWDLFAMSDYSTITSLSESPMKEGLIYAGTDDGIIQVTEDGGKNWRKIDFAKIKGLPKTAFVNDIKADLFDENVVYAVFDNHKYGDYNPYIFKSSDKGVSWEDISGNLPDRTLLWRMVQDHERKDLLFLGTEFGVYFSIDGAKSWIKLNGGFPNISVRDLAIQKRENDLVAGTFGRGIYILDDYSALRTIDTAQTAQLFKPQNGTWEMQKRILGGSRKASQGDNYYVADNPPYGVTFTYYIKENLKSVEAQRKEKEKEIEKENGTVEVPDWDILDKEKNEIPPMEWLFIYDKDDRIVQKIKGTNKKGFNRIAWDLSTIPTKTITKQNMNRDNGGNMAKPGDYTAQLYRRIDGIYTPIAERVNFELLVNNKQALQNSSPEVVASHWEATTALSVKVSDSFAKLNDAKDHIELLLKSYDRANNTDDPLLADLLELRDKIAALESAHTGSKSRDEVGEKNEYPTMRDYLWAANSGGNTYGPTKSQTDYLQYAEQLHNDMSTRLNEIEQMIPPLEKRLERIGAPNIRN